jgi:integrase/recombinase XerD
MTLAHIGARIDEVLRLQWTDIDFDNLLVTLHGKGSNDRIVPFSVELRRYLFRWQKVAPKNLMVFVSRNRTKLGRRDVLRDVKVLCRTLGFNPPERSFHAFRRALALNYIRRGGSVFHLQKALGHSSLEMTHAFCQSSNRRLAGVASEGLAVDAPRVIGRPVTIRVSDGQAE